MDNVIMISGTVGRNPLKRVTTADGRSMARFPLKYHREYASMDGKQNRFSYFPIVCFGEIADHLCESFIENDPIMIWGHLSQRELTEGGSKTLTVEIIATRIGIDITKESMPFESTTIE